jgi:phosphoglycerate dehydrogenase-like enzyme
MKILLSANAAQRLTDRFPDVFAGQPYQIVLADDSQPGVDFDCAFISRDVTGLSSKFELEPATQHFYDLLLNAPSLQWVHTHSAGSDRPIFSTLLNQRRMVTTSAGANAAIVAQSALAGILALARHFPKMAKNQAQRQWRSLMADDLPADLEGQTAVIVGWGAIGQKIAGLLQALGVHCEVIRFNLPVGGIPGVKVHLISAIATVLPQANWLILACPLSAETKRLIDAAALSRLPRGAHIINVARGEMIVEADLVAALQAGRLGGAYLDVFEYEPLRLDSPLWNSDNVIVTPHSAGHSQGNAQRVEDLFFNNLSHFMQQQPLLNLVQ